MLYPLHCKEAVRQLGSRGKASSHKQNRRDCVSIRIQERLIHAKAGPIPPIPLEGCLFTRIRKILNAKSY